VPSKLLGHGHARQIEQRRRHVEVAHLRRHAQRRLDAEREAEDERHPDDGHQHVAGVAVHAVLAEGLAVVGDEDEQRLL